MGRALPEIGVPSSAAAYAAALEGLVGIDTLMLQKFPQLPSLYGSGARYKRQDMGGRRGRKWRTPHDIALEGWSDCEGLAGWRAAELRVSGEDPNARVACYHTSPRTFHAVVARGDDTIEDPSRFLGMRGRPLAATPLTIGEINAWELPWPERWQVVVGRDPAPHAGHRVTFSTHKHRRGRSGVVRIPTAVNGACVLGVTSCCGDEAEAIERGANMLSMLSDNIVRDPKALAYLNPYSAAALELYSQPEMHQALKKVGSGVKKLGHSAGSALHSLASLFHHHAAPPPPDDEG